MKQPSEKTAEEAAGRRDTIRGIINDLIVRRGAGEAVTDESVIARWPDLMPELADELRKLKAVERAEHDADSAQQYSDHQAVTAVDEHVDVRWSQTGLRLRCPHCHNPVELVEESPVSDVVCPSCGTHIGLTDDTDQTFRAAEQEMVNHFQLLDRVGVGAFGSVWSARDTQLDRMVAIKIPRKGQLSTVDIEQFIREARTAAQLKHPNIVSVLEVGRYKDRVYIACDLIQGVDLGGWLNGQLVTPHEAAKLCVTLADALQHAHEQGVIHRDLKPSNIMLDTQGEPHLTDFGLAKREAGEMTMTVEGKLLGTPAYMPPEQARGSAYDADARSDVYSLGVILFELITGERPFRGSTRMLLHQVLTEDAPSPRRLNQAVPKDLETICLKCLEKDPHRRYQTAAELQGDLRRFLEGAPVLARPITRVNRAWRWCRRKPLVASLTAMVATLVLFLAIAGPTVVMLQKRLQTQNVQTSVDALLMAAPEHLPYALAVIGPQRQSVRSLLLQSANDRSMDDHRRLNAKLALAHLGEVDHEYLIQNIDQAPNVFARHIIEAFDKVEVETGSKLESAFAAALMDLAKSEVKRLRRRARLAIALLHFGRAGPAREMLNSRAADPVQRVIFIDTFAVWHGDLADDGLAETLRSIEDPAVRSGLCCALAIAKPADAEKQLLKPILQSWYLRDPSPAVHSAAELALSNWGERLSSNALAVPSSAAGDWFVTAHGITMVKIPAGKFVRQHRRGAREVVISHPFFLSTKEVSIRLFRDFVNDPATDSTTQDWKWDRQISPTDDCPATFVTWYDAARFCNWLSRNEGLEACYDMKTWVCQSDASGYRLPSSDESEYACRAGTATKWCFGKYDEFIRHYSIFSASHTERCGSRLPNSWGLFDVHGNVREWCNDSYEVGNSSDPDEFRWTRDGAFNNEPATVHSSLREAMPAENRQRFIGFRLARNCP